MVAASAGLSPAYDVAPDTRRAMSEKGIDIRDHFPKGLRQLARAEFDLVINISGFDIPDGTGAEIRAWDIPDPVYLKYVEHCEVRDAIERLVMGLIVELRRERNLPGLRGGTGRTTP
jgi:protein-tyrosine-phosphatase